MSIPVVLDHRGHAARRAAVIATVLAAGLLIGIAARTAGASDPTVVVESASVTAANSVVATTAPQPSTSVPLAVETTAPQPSTSVPLAVETTAPQPSTSAPLAVATTAPQPSTSAPLAVATTAPQPSTSVPLAVETTAPQEVAVVAVEAPVPAPSNLSTCRADLPGAVMTIVIPDISYSCPVYAGGQSVIDLGVATLVTDLGANALLVTRPGDAGTLWIAGHRSSHGGPFAAVPNLADGAIVTVSADGRSASYRIVGRVRIETRDGYAVDQSGQATGEATMDAIFRPDHGATHASRLLLQTCDGQNFRWMIYADLVSA